MHLFKNNTRSFTSAAVEILLIVAGILLALGIDEWRQDQQERELEREYLEAIKVGLEGDLAEIEDRIFPEIESRLAAAARLNQLSVDDPPLRREEQLQVTSDINTAGFMRTFTAKRAAIDDLISTGNLKLIRDQSLRLALLEYFDEVSKWQPYDEWSRHLIWYEFRTEVTRIVPIELQQVRLGERDAASRETMLELIDNPVFQYGLINVRGSANWQRGRYGAIADRIKAIIADLETKMDDE